MILSNKLTQLKYICFFISTLIMCSIILAVTSIEKDFTKFKFQIISEKSGNVHVYVNNFTSPYIFYVNKNEKKIIEVDNLFQDIKLLRIDPPKGNNNIFKIKFLKTQQEFFQFSKIKF